MNKSVNLAKSGYYYLKVQQPGQPTIIIFETEEWLFDYILEKLNISVYEGFNADIELLSELCTNENYNVFLKAYEDKDHIKNNFYAELDEMIKPENEFGTSDLAAFKFFNNIMDDIDSTDDDYPLEDELFDI